MVERVPVEQFRQLRHYLAEVGPENEGSQSEKSATAIGDHWRGCVVQWRLCVDNIPRRKGPGARPRAFTPIILDSRAVRGMVSPGRHTAGTDPKEWMSKPSYHALIIFWDMCLL